MKKFLFISKNYLSKLTIKINTNEIFISETTSRCYTEKSGFKVYSDKTYVKNNSLDALESISKIKYFCIRKSTVNN